MPILHFTNSTDEALNVGTYFAGLPSVCHNELAPGETWEQDFGTLLFSSFEVRVDRGPSNRYQPDSAAKGAGAIAAAGGKGVASVLKGAGAAFGAFPTGAAAKAGTSKAMDDAGDLMNAAGKRKQRRYTLQTKMMIMMSICRL
jgi:hypothetical protein